MQKHPECASAVVPCIVAYDGTPEDKRRLWNFHERKALLLVWQRVCPAMPKDVVKNIFDLM